jgi:hypothetical protein
MARRPKLENFLQAAVLWPFRGQFSNPNFGSSDSRVSRGRHNPKFRSPAKSQGEDFVVDLRAASGLLRSIEGSVEHRRQGKVKAT